MITTEGDRETEGDRPCLLVFFLFPLLAFHRLNVARPFMCHLQLTNVRCVLVRRQRDRGRQETAENTETKTSKQVDTTMDACMDGRVGLTQREREKERERERERDRDKNKIRNNGRQWETMRVTKIQIERESKISTDGRKVARTQQGFNPTGPRIHSGSTAHRERDTLVHVRDSCAAHVLDTARASSVRRLDSKNRQNPHVFRGLSWGRASQNFGRTTLQPECLPESVPGSRAKSCDTTPRSDVVRNDEAATMADGHDTESAAKSMRAPTCVPLRPTSSRVHQQLSQNLGVHVTAEEFPT